jgi:hypothetical protein
VLFGVEFPPSSIVVRRDFLQFLGRAVAKVGGADGL